MRMFFFPKYALNIFLLVERLHPYKNIEYLIFHKKNILETKIFQSSILFFADVTLVT